MSRATAIFAPAILALSLVATGQTSPQTQAQARPWDGIPTDPPFLWEDAEVPYGYPAGDPYRAPDGTFSARFVGKPELHHVPQSGATTDLYLGSFQHRKDLVSLVRVTVSPTPKLVSPESNRSFLLGSQTGFEKSLNAKRTRIALRDLTGSGGPMLLEYEIEYELDAVPLRSCGFWALSTGKIVRASAQYCPLLNAEEVALVRHFPTTVALPGMEALNHSARRPTAAPSTKIDGPFRTMALEGGVTLTLPSNWQVLSDSTRQTLDAARVAQETEVLGAPLDSKLPFAANLVGDGGHVLAMVNARYYPQMQQTQKDVREIDGESLQAIDDAIREECQSNMQRTGQTITWLGVRRVTIGDLIAMVASYERLSADRRDHYCVRLVRIHDGPRSFTLTLSYRKSMALLLKPICDHILHSLQRSTLPAVQPNPNSSGGK